jgi:hypothetical protein
MAHRNTREEQQLLKLLKNLALPEETRSDWLNRIENGGMTEELVDEIYAALSSAGTDDMEGSELMQHSATFTRLVRQWRLAEQSKSFRKH